jgi:transcriptional regulator with XRE-family HTH domain
MPPRTSGKTPRELRAFGKRVRQLRDDRGWTQERLAEAAEMHAVQISHIEHGRNNAKLTTVCQLARAFGMTASELLRSVR